MVDKERKKELEELVATEAFDEAGADLEELARKEIGESGRESLEAIRSGIAGYVDDSKAERVLELSKELLALYGDLSVDDDVRAELVQRKRRTIAHAIDSERLIAEDAADEAKDRVLSTVLAGATRFGEAAVKIAAKVGVEAVKAAVSGGALGLLI